MSRLTKGMYGTEFEKGSNLFGLRCGTCRSNDFVHNGGWYNRHGEKLGWGDLAPKDFQTIAEGLEEGELFIVLSESDSFWNFVTRPGLLGSQAAVKPDVDAPGVEYVVEHARYIIARMQLYFVDSLGTRAEATVNREGLTFTILKMDEAKRLIVS